MALEEGGKAINSVIDAMKSQPMTLALLIMNIGLLTFMYFSSTAAHKEREHEMDLLYQNRESVGKLLAECIPQPK